ncbi:hypothetical protein F511_09552 [Dorcoceras hygrometricum]|uniref:Protein BIC1 n=1 Tax=Dorcoceras hygrometricum TaxID=472368 RepID=A0A2Z7CVU6_9LAMI|nr:hypothetical protein F511_09552 [Dorcoceras hygrometricum]
MRPQNLETPSSQSESDNPTAESDASISSNGDKSAVAAHHSRTYATVGSTRGGGAAEKSSGRCGRERLRRHWVEVSGRVWIPDIWGQEDLLKDWIDCSAFDSSLVGSSIISARESLVEQAGRATSTRFGIQNSC